MIFHLSFQFCEFSHIGNHPQGELGKFGYMSEKKAEKFKNHAIFW
jgi:hypothetical protein